MFGLFRRKKVFGDAEKRQFVEAISEMLEVQKSVASGHKIEDDQGHINRRAIGYIYGFIDAALMTIGQDMSDVSIGVPITFQVLRHLFPGCEERYTQYLSNFMGKDEAVTLGASHGGQQYVDFAKPNAPGAPMGLARYLIDGEANESAGIAKSRQP